LPPHALATCLTSPTCQTYPPLLDDMRRYRSVCWALTYTCGRRHRCPPTTPAQTEHADRQWTGYSFFAWVDRHGRAVCAACCTQRQHHYQRFCGGTSDGGQLWGFSGLPPRLSAQKVRHHLPLRIPLGTPHMGLPSGDSASATHTWLQFDRTKHQAERSRHAWIRQPPLGTLTPAARCLLCPHLTLGPVLCETASPAGFCCLEHTRQLRHIAQRHMSPAAACCLACHHTISFLWKDSHQS